MTRPRFSVVIPTRERPTYLRHALATCLDQEIDDYEILVCDNGVSAAAKQVVDEAGASRVRYLRAPGPLAMTDSWEFAVSQAQGDFILVIGDDDGLLPHALRELDRLLSRLQQPVLRWEAAFYTWPDVDLPGQGDFLRLPLGRGLHMLDATSTMASVISFETAYVRLPTFYNTAIHRSIVEDLQRRGGRVFRSRYPDVYSGFVVGHLVGRYPSVDAPMSIAGVSGRSTGVANLFRYGQSPIDADYRELNAQARIERHSSVPDLPIFPEVPVADAFQLAKDRFFPDDETLCLDRRRLLMHCLAACPPSSNGAALEAIRASVVDDPELQSWLESTLSSTVVTPRPEIRLRPERMGFHGESLNLDAAGFGVRNAQDAVGLAERILQYRRVDVIDLSGVDAGL